MRNLIFAAIVGISFTGFAACQQGGADSKPITTGERGTLVIHTKGNGTKIEGGNMVTMTFKTFVGDSMVASTDKDYHGPRDMFIPEKDTSKNAPPLPEMLTAIMMLSEGDSATYSERLDTAQQKMAERDFGKPVTEVRHVLKVHKVMDKAATDARKKEGDNVPTTVSGLIADYKMNKLGDRLQKTASGLQYVLLEKGNGKQIEDGWLVPTNYHGVLLGSEKIFDSSYRRGAPADFTVGQMIPGFNEGMKLLTKGSKACLFIPWSLGYGEQGIPNGPIGPKEDLVFYIHVE